MKVGDVIKLPCGAAVEIKYLAPPDDRGDKGLVAVRIESEGGLFTLEYTGTRVLRDQVREIELNFYPENIPVLATALGEMAKQLLAPESPKSAKCSHCGRVIEPCSIRKEGKSCGFGGWIHTSNKPLSHFCDNTYNHTACPKQS